METVKMTNEMTCGNYEFPANADDKSMKLRGDYKISPDGKLDSLSGDITLGKDYIGKFNINTSNSSRRMNLNLENDLISSDVVSAINSLTIEIESKYKPTNV